MDWNRMVIVMRNMHVILQGNILQIEEEIETMPSECLLTV